MALLEDEGKVGVGLMTKAAYVCHFWLNNEGSIGLEEKERGPLASKGTMATIVFL